MKVNKYFYSDMEGSLVYIYESHKFGDEFIYTIEGVDGKKKKEVVSKKEDEDKPKFDTKEVVKDNFDATNVDTNNLESVANAIIDQSNSKDDAFKKARLMMKHDENLEGLEDAISTLYNDESMNIVDITPDTLIAFIERNKDMEVKDILKSLQTMLND